MSSNQDSYRVAIVGAGIAGLACARVLLEAGHQVTVFDKSRGVGGRMSTRRGDGWCADHGAQYFTARGPDFVAEVARWIAAGAAAPWPARIVRIGPSGPPEAVPPLTQRYVGVQGMTAPARLLSAGVETIANTTVAAVMEESGHWHLSTVEHGVLSTPFDAVVVAVPGPQVVPLLRQAAPRLAAVAQRAYMRPTWAVMAQCGNGPQPGFDAAFVTQGPLRWIAFDTSKPGRTGIDTCVLLANSDWSQAHIEATAEYVIASLLTAFQEVGGPTVSAATAHRWLYAEPVGPMRGAPAGFVWCGPDGIGLCGDWLGGGNVEGAWHSGNRLGLAMVDSLAMR